MSLNEDRLDALAESLGDLTWEEMDFFAGLLVEEVKENGTLNSWTISKHLSEWSGIQLKGDEE